MKKIYLIISSISLALLLSACGGGSGGTFEGVVDSNNSNNTIQVTICPVYTTLLSNDTLVSESDDTTVTIRDTDGVKDVCVNTGAAYILR